jgi:beta-lactamase class A
LIDFQTHRRSRTLRVLGILAVAVYVIGQFIAFQLSLPQLPTTWRIGGESFQALSINNALRQVSIDLQTPIALQYYTHTLTLKPSSINFTLDLTTTTQTIYDLRAQNSLVDFMRRLIFQPPAARDVPLTTSYSTEKVRAVLAELSSQLDQPAQAAVFQLDAETSIKAGQDGYQLNIIASLKPIEAALNSAVAAEREVDLVIEHQIAPPPSSQQLKQYLKERLARFPGNASLFIKNLQTGAEIEVNPALAYSALGVMKIAILTEAYRKLDAAPDVTTTYWLTSSIVTENNFSANNLLGLIGDKDIQRGAELLSGSLHNLGLRNTFMLAGYGYTTTLPTPLTPANSITTTLADPDPYIQTSATDVGLLLEAIYQCSRKGGALLVVYPDKFNAAECDQIISLLKRSDPNGPSALRGGLPDGTSIAYSLGANNDTRAAASIVFTPGVDYVLVVFLNTPNQPLDWNAVNPFMANLARATYQFFNP